MKIRTHALAALFACAVAAPAVVNVDARTLADDDVTLKGCLVKGEGDGSGYLLTNAPAMPTLQRSSADSKIEPTTVGTSGGFESVFYWLDGDNDLKKNIGHQVEVKGEVKGDIKDGEIKLDRKDNWTEMKIKSDGREMTAKVPNASLMPAPHEDKDVKSHVLVRKVDVSKVTMLAATCDEPR
jgi:hypothetical protein